MAQNLRIKQITLPSGSTYNIYDELTRLMITSAEFKEGTAGVKYNTNDLVFFNDVLYRFKEDVTTTADSTITSLLTADKIAATTVDNEFDRVRQTVSQVMNYIGVTTTSLTDGSTVNPIEIDGKTVTVEAGNVVISGTGGGQKEYVWSGSAWNEFGSGNLLKALAFADTASGTYLKATGGTVNINTYSADTTTLKATASGTAVQINSTTAAVTGYSNTLNDTFVKSYPGATSNLVTSTASKATAGTAFNVAKKKASQTSVASGALGAETTTRSDNSPMWGAQVSSEVLSFTFKPISTTNIQEADSTEQSITPYSFADVTVATGSLSSTATGDSVMTGLGNATTGSALTSLGTPSTEDVAKTISISTQPTVTLSSVATGGDVTVATGVTSGTASATVTVNAYENATVQVSPDNA